MQAGVEGMSFEVNGWRWRRRGGGGSLGLRSVEVKEVEVGV